MNPGYQVVLFNTDRCTSKEMNATLPQSSGNPTLGFTTSQILA
jgi:hypothetical protein